MKVSVSKFAAKKGPVLATKSRGYSHGGSYGGHHGGYNGGCGC